MTKQHHILMLEDEQYYRNVYGAGLEAAGCKVTYCKNGEEAAQQVKSNKYDAIIVDLIMPLMSGIKFLRENKKHIKNTLIYILTTLESESDRIDAINEGVSAYLLKTETAPAELAARIQKDLAKPTPHGKSKK